jgi:hypothetical protein
MVFFLEAVRGSAESGPALSAALVHSAASNVVIRRIDGLEGHWRCSLSSEAHATAVFIDEIRHFHFLLAMAAQGL